MDPFSAIFLGIIEGITEFLPISSTGHLILVGALLGPSTESSKLFDVVIQLGAILAIVVLYWRKFLQVITGLRSDPQARYFVRNIALAFLPAMVIGAFAHEAIKTYLFTPTVVAISMVAGGIAILAIEKWKPQPRMNSTESMDWKTALKIGMVQCLAMIPGTSRSGATIMGALCFGVERKAAAEFSFFLAVPTMLAAASYDLYKSRHALTGDGAAMIAVGFAVSFLVALLVVRWLVRFISRHGFELFAWYRIAVGAAILLAIG